MFTPADREFMARALALAERGLFTTTPNPRVGCVVVRDGEVVGEGFHERAGEAHAEVNALRAAGGRAEGATAYVTLEPCNHHGRTPPCVEALVAAKVERVVVAMGDPNPKVSGKGFAALRAAGVEVDAGLLEDEARELNVGFVSRMTRGRPWVRLKIAASLDGKTALADGDEPVDHRRGSTPRRASLARAGVRDPDRYRHGEGRRSAAHGARRRDAAPAAAGARGLAPGGAAHRAHPRRRQPPGRRRARRPREGSPRCATRGAEVVVLPNAAGKVELADLVRELGRRALNEIHVEAGFKLNGSLVAAGVVDELLVYLAPRALGETGQGMFNLPAIERLADARRLRLVDVERVGEDVRLRARFG